MADDGQVGERPHVGLSGCLVQRLGCNGKVRDPMAKILADTKIRGFEPLWLEVVNPAGPGPCQR